MEEKPRDGRRKIVKKAESSASMKLRRESNGVAEFARRELRSGYPSKHGEGNLRSDLVSSVANKRHGGDFSARDYDSRRAEREDQRAFAWIARSGYEESHSRVRIALTTATLMRREFIKITVGEFGTRAGNCYLEILHYVEI